MPQVEVTFDIDANGIVSVSAKDKASGKTQSVRIEASTALSKDEIEKLKRDAEVHRAEDLKKKELVEARNMADHTIHVAEKAVKDAGDKIPAEIKDGIAQRIADLNKAKETGTTEGIKKELDALSAEMQKIGEFMNKNAGGPAAGAPPEGAQPKA
jgi:molecular chaperone DnaK